MFATIAKPPISHRRKAFALAVAGAADLLRLSILPLIVEGALSPIEDIIDVLTAIALIAICGFKWQFILAFFIELIPGLDVLPTWSAVALLIPSSADTIQTSYTTQPPQQNPTLHPPIEVTAIAVPPIQSTPQKPSSPPPFPPPSP